MKKYINPRGAGISHFTNALVNRQDSMPFAKWNIDKKEKK
jgi:hypothetical protein